MIGTDRRQDRTESATTLSGLRVMLAVGTVGQEPSARKGQQMGKSVIVLEVRTSDSVVAKAI